MWIDKEKLLPASDETIDVFHFVQMDDRFRPSRRHPHNICFEKLLKSRTLARKENNKWIVIDTWLWVWPSWIRSSHEARGEWIVKFVTFPTDIAKLDRLRLGHWERTKFQIIEYLKFCVIRMSTLVNVKLFKLSDQPEEGRRGERLIVDVPVPSWPCKQSQLGT